MAVICQARSVQSHQTGVCQVRPEVCQAPGVCPATGLGRWSCQAPSGRSDHLVASCLGRCFRPPRLGIGDQLHCGEALLNILARAQAAVATAPAAATAPAVATASAVATSQVRQRRHHCCCQVYTPILMMTPTLQAPKRVALAAAQWCYRARMLMKIATLKATALVPKRSLQMRGLHIPLHRRWQCGP